MQNYKKVAGQTLEDVMEGDYWRANKDYMHKAANFFNASTMTEKEMMNNTKNFTMRYRLNREIDFTEDFRKKYLTKEYGNYEKYDKNSITTEYDDGNENT